MTELLSFANEDPWLVALIVLLGFSLILKIVSILFDDFFGHCVNLVRGHPKTKIFYCNKTKED
jgi:hypothetical protein